MKWSAKCTVWMIDESNSANLLGHRLKGFNFDWKLCLKGIWRWVPRLLTNSVVDSVASIRRNPDKFLQVIIYWIKRGSTTIHQAQNNSRNSGILQKMATVLLGCKRNYLRPLIRKKTKEYGDYCSMCPTLDLLSKEITLTPRTKGSSIKIIHDDQLWRIEVPGILSFKMFDIFEVYDLFLSFLKWKKFIAKNSCQRNRLLPILRTILRAFRKLTFWSTLNSWRITRRSVSNWKETVVRRK